MCGYFGSTWLELGGAVGMQRVIEQTSACARCEVQVLERWLMWLNPGDLNPISGEVGNEGRDSAEMIDEDLSILESVDPKHTGKMNQAIELVGNRRRNSEGWRWPELLHEGLRFAFYQRSSRFHDDDVIGEALCL